MLAATMRLNFCLTMPPKAHSFSTRFQSRLIGYRRRLMKAVAILLAWCTSAERGNRSRRWLSRPAIAGPAGALDEAVEEETSMTLTINRCFGRAVTVLSS